MVDTYEYMFYGCSKLSNIDTSRFSSRYNTVCCTMFSGCESLTSVDLTNFKVNDTKNVSGMLANLTSLKQFTIGQDICITMNYLMGYAENLQYAKVGTEYSYSLDMISSPSTGYGTYARLMFFNVETTDKNIGEPVMPEMFAPKNYMYDTNSRRTFVKVESNKKLSVKHEENGVLIENPQTIDYTCDTSRYSDASFYKWVCNGGQTLPVGGDWVELTTSDPVQIMYDYTEMRAVFDANQVIDYSNPNPLCTAVFYYGKIQNCPLASYTDSYVWPYNERIGSLDNTGPWQKE
ncbi:MAG: hypothetical protein Q4F54_05095 [Coriobacteriia bacterium]|nr:hypothetical protein [Coriobacteriia bacterium]